MKYYLECLKKYATFSGRARRSEYWYFVLFSAIFSLGLGWIKFIVSAIVPGPSLFILYCLYLLATLIPCSAVSVRRLHDVGKSGWLYLWWVLVGLMFCLSMGLFLTRAVSYTLASRLVILFALGGLAISIWFIVLFFKDSQPGTNKYGPNPKGIEA